MSETSKRDASQAFGNEDVIDKNSTSKKRNRRRKSDKISSSPDNPVNRDNVQLSPDEASHTGNAGISQTQIHKKSGATRSLGPQQSETQQMSAPSVTVSTVDDVPVSGGIKESKSARKKKAKKARVSVAGEGQPQPQAVAAQTETKKSKDAETKSTELVFKFEADFEDDDTEEDRPTKQISRRKSSTGTGEQSTPNNKHRKDKNKSQISTEWNLSEPLGGTFINHDPIITPNQDRLILATRHSIHIYSISTSLPIRMIQVTRKSEISSYDLVIGQEDSLIVGKADGGLVKYDTATGKEVWSHKFHGIISAVTSTSSDDSQEAYLMVINNHDATFQMSTILFDKSGKQIGRNTLLSQKSLIKPQIAFSADLGVVVVCTPKTIMVGKLDDDNTPIKWHAIPTTGGPINCFDAQIRAPKSNRKRSAEPRVDVALGIKTGEIHVYNDVLNHSGQNISPRKLHWHRSAPRTVKFSPDSNYLISGGDETVLIIWQLETGQKQTLPHLTATILNVTIASQGAAYALRLADNSVMVISTSDLKASANVSNLIIDASSRAPYLPGLKVPAVLYPGHDDRLLVAYSLQSLNDRVKPTEKSSTMLQTFDVAAQLQLSRQALSRNFVSSVNVDLTGKSNSEPDVTHLAISHDGKWLATVDQWTPNGTDIEAAYLGRDDQNDKAQATECNLRFWSTNPATTGTDEWEMNTRIDSPVSVNYNSKRRAILNLTTNPVKPQVAVADTNRCLKIYSPKARMRSGVPTRNADGQQLFTWTCDHELFFDETSPSGEPEFATVSFSDDGSVLAAAWSSNSHLKARVHLIDTKLGSKAASLPGILSHGNAQLAWLGKYLLGLSNKLCIYDTVKMERTFCIDIDKQFDHSKSIMAVNRLSGIAAISVAPRATQAQSHIILLDIKAGYDRKPLMDQKISSQVPILLAEKTRGGFLIIDGEGRSLQISPPGLAELVLAKQDLPEKKLITSTLENVFGKARKVIQAPTEQSENSGSRSLDDVFKYATTASAPAAKDLFNQVAAVLAGAA